LASLSYIYAFATYLSQDEILSYKPAFKTYMFSARWAGTALNAINHTKIRSEHNCD